MRRGVHWVLLGLSLVVGTAAFVNLGTSVASDISPEFQGVWQRTDRPVADGAVNRTWMWGPNGHFEAFMEPYADSPGGERLVQYFEKSRMEITNPQGDPESIWFVTNGLLARELITGEMQTGDESFELREPAELQVAGDAHPESPTYATFRTLLDENPTSPETPILHTVDRYGTIGSSSSLVEYGVVAEYYVPETNKTVASVFWNFMNSKGVILVDDELQSDSLFENPFFAVGLPITGAYWMHIPVGNQWQDVLVQCFERRCLTYTPENDDGWQVEAGNIGQHYYEWRYETSSEPIIPPDADDGLNGISPPDDQELGPPVPGACEAESQAVLVHVSDGIGNVNANSWGQGTGGDWVGGFDASPSVSIGETITVSFESAGSCEPHEYRVQRYRPGGEVEILQGWSEQSQFGYEFQAEDAGEYLMLIVEVRDQDPRAHFDGRDDYTYLTYFVE